MKLIERLGSTPAWFALPSLVLVAAIASTVAGYSPLTFDPSLYQASPALANELAHVDAAALESSGSSRVGGDGASGKMEDGTWTGYAVCGDGNTDEWKPYYVAVTIEVKDDKVVRIVDICGTSSAGEGSTSLAWDPSENQEYLDHAIDGRGGAGVRAQLEAQIAESGKPSGIDAVSGATYSSTAIYNAIVDAMKRAAGEVTALTVQPSAGEVPNTSKKVSGGSKANAELADGTWTGYAACGKGNDDDWSPYYVAVTIKVKGGKVVAIKKVAGQATGDTGDARLSWNASENQKYLSWAISGRGANAGVKTQMDKQVKASGVVSGIDTVSGATYSSEAIYEAYAQALAKSAKAAGSKSASSKTKKKSKSKSKSKSSSDSSSSAKKVTADDADASKVAEGTLADGTWAGYAACGTGNDDDWSPYYVVVTVKVSGGKPVSVQSAQGSSTGDAGAAALSWNASENQKYLDWASQGRTKKGVTYAGVVAQITAAIAAGNNPTSIDAVSGATYSSQAIFRAYYAALSKSAAAAGSSLDDPSESGASGQADESSQQDTSGVESDQTGGDDNQSGTESDQTGGDDNQSGTESDQTGGDDSSSGEQTGGDDNSGEDQSGESADPQPTPVMADGTYEGYGWCEDPTYDDDWDPYYIIVQLKVENGAISQLADISGDASGKVDSNYKYQTYNASYLNRAINGTGKYKGVKAQLAAQLAQGSSVSGIDTVSGATFSSKAIVEAFIAAAQKAEATIS